MLHWQTMRGERNPQFLVKGTELESAKYGDFGRFRIISYRWYPTGNYQEPDRRYRVRDADRITDAEIREGKRAPIIGDFATEDEAIAFCDQEQS